MYLFIPWNCVCDQPAVSTADPPLPATWPSFPPLPSPPPPPCRAPTPCPRGCPSPTWGSIPCTGLCCAPSPALSPGRVWLPSCITCRYRCVLAAPLLRAGPSVIQAGRRRTGTEPEGTGTGRGRQRVRSGRTWLEEEDTFFASSWRFPVHRSWPLFL